MTWHYDDGTDTCKSDAMWSLFCPGRKNTPPFKPNPEGFFFFFFATMEEDLRLPRDLHSPPLSSDPEPFPELTRSTSDSSAVTVDNSSKDFSHHCSAAPFPDQSRRWTDQLHDLYLNSLEASFVNELHHSIRLCGWSFHNNTDEAYKCRTLQNSLNMPTQSLDLQDGRQKKISLERIAPMLESTADSHVTVGSQLGHALVDRACSLGEPSTYDYGLLCDEEIHARGSSAFTNRSQRCSLEKQCICCSFHAESVCTSTEVTDQNFKDEVSSSSGMPMAKRLKTAAADGSNSDQVVVPFGKFLTTDVSTSSNSTSKNKGRELLSELPESFHFPKSDLPYFLREG